MESQALLREWLRNTERSLSRPATPESRWHSHWTIALIHARLRDRRRAQEATAQAGEAPEGTPVDQLLFAEAPALTALEECDRVAELLRKREEGSYYDPCAREELLPMRGDTRYADIFAHCPPLPPR